jgi:hypothetical protein
VDVDVHHAVGRGKGSASCSLESFEIHPGGGEWRNPSEGWTELATRRRGRAGGGVMGVVCLHGPLRKPARRDHRYSDS